MTWMHFVSRAHMMIPIALFFLDSSHDPTLPVANVECADPFNCKMKVAGGGNNCDGTVIVPCTGDLRFSYGADGNPTYYIGGDDDGQGSSRALLGAAVEEPSASLAVGGGIDADASSSSSSLGKGEDVTISSSRSSSRRSSSRLRGAKGSKRGPVSELVE